MSELYAAFLGALQGTISVLFILLSGYVSSRLGLLDSHTIRRLSTLCANVFLPSLIITQMGPAITIGQLYKVWMMPVWGFVSSILAHLIGFLGKSALGLPNWTILAAGRANSNAFPLLLLESLAHVGILDILKQADETPSQTLSRARSFVLLNSLVQEVITFTIAARILSHDLADQKYPGSSPRTSPGPSRRSSGIQDAEAVSLLDDQDDPFDEHDGDYISSVHRLSDTDSSRISRFGKRLEKYTKRAVGSINPVVASAGLAILLGIVPQLHETFLSGDGLFYPSIIHPLSNLGQLFVTLQIFVVGAELQAVHTANPKLLPTIFSLLVRYAVMPTIAATFVYFTAKKGIYADDPLLWFLLILIPCGPSAMLLISIAEAVGVDQGPIAGYLTISYAFAPMIALWCAVAFKVIEVVQGS